MKSIHKYLQGYAESEVLSVAQIPRHHHFTHALVIPAYRESADFVFRFCQRFDQHILLIVVLNQPTNDTDQQPQQQLHQDLLASMTIHWQQDQLQLLQSSASQAYVLLVDRFQQPIDAEQGVGCARKIGCDLAVALYQQKQLQSPWIGSSDADAELPDHYFSTLAAAPTGHSLVIFDFQHIGSPSDLTQHTQLYETALQYYVDGLRWAGSHYSYHTIGSILAVHLLSYCQARGFPKRSAGEDFYLVNKLIKLGDVWRPNNCLIQIQARESNRVPFGTGPAVKKIAELAQPKRDYCYYHPQVFIELKALLQWLSKLPQQPEQWPNGERDLSEYGWQALLNIGFARFMRTQLGQHTSAKQFKQQLRGWFDAFKTLKFIHHVREMGWADIPLQQAIEEAPFASSPAGSSPMVSNPAVSNPTGG